MQSVESAVTSEWGGFDAYYESMSEKDFQQYVVRAGLQNNGDIELLKDLIIASESILLVGGAYGRELQQFQEWNLRSKVVCVEKIKKHVEFMHSRYGMMCDCVHADILDFHFTQKFDLVLILFGTISEFTQAQAQQLYKKLSSILTSEGVVVVDTLVSLDNDSRFVDHDEDSYVFVAHGKSIKARASCKFNVEQDISDSQLRVNASFKYISSTNIARDLLLLTLF